MDRQVDRQGRCWHELSSVAPRWCRHHERSAGWKTQSCSLLLHGQSAMVLKTEEEGWTLREKHLKLQPYLDFWASGGERDFSGPALYRYGVSLSSCLSSCLPLSLFSSAPLFTSPIPPLTLPHFPHFGMSMCYLLTLCMNDNMYVYSYNRIPFSCSWLKMVWMLYRFRFSVHLLFHFSYIFNVSRAWNLYFFFYLSYDSSFCLEVTCTLNRFLLLSLKRQYLLLLNERGELYGV